MTARQHRTISLGEGPEALFQLDNDWRALWRQDTQTDFVTSYGWYTAYLDTLEPTPKALIVLSFYIEDRCVGILPLIQRKQQSTRLQPVILEVPLLTGMDLNRILLARDQRLIDWWPLIRQTLSSSVTGFFIVKATNVPLDTGTASTLAGMEAGSITRIQGHSCWFNCNQQVDQIRQHYRSRLKKILRKGYKGLEREGPLRFQAITNRDELEPAYKIFLELEMSGWKGRQGTALALAPQSRRFHESFLFSDSDAIAPRINLLFCGERAVAAQLCVVCGDTISLLKIAFDQSLSRYSPGSVLLDQLLADSCQNHRLNRVNLITGQPWMDNWGPEKTPVADIWLFAPASIAIPVRWFLAMRNRLRTVTQRFRRAEA